MTLVKWTPKRNMFNVFDDVEKMVNQALNAYRLYIRSVSKYNLP